MPYTTPTVDQFTTRFPIFADNDPDQIEMILAEAASTGVDTDWREADYQPAIMYLAAHLLSTDNSQEGDEVSIGAAGAGGVASESFGGLSISYDKGNQSGSLSSSEAYGSTEYGRRYLMMLRGNKPGVMVV